MLRRVLKTGLALFAFWIILIPLFERFAPRRFVRTYQRLTAHLLGTGCGFIPGFGIVETTGRRTGRTRRTPVGGRLTENEFWFVAGAGREAFYVRNLEADPRVRVKALGNWHTGTANILEDDDATRRMFWVNPLNGLFVLLAGGSHLTVRVDLES